MRNAMILLVAAALSGCAVTDKLLTNRVDVTLALDECRVDSRWLGPGISTAVDQRDCEVILNAVRLRAMEQVMQRQQQQGERKP